MIISIFIMGCSTKTTVVLLDNRKIQNAVIVSTNKGSKQLDRVGSFIQLTDKNKEPTNPKMMSKKEIDSRYAMLFNIEPLEPRTYIVYFKKNSRELTEESKKTLNEALKTIKDRSPCVVDVIGHTDTVGSSESNRKVSLKRASYLKSMIESIELKKIVVSFFAKGYGEEDLLMKTSNNVSEAKNRNVEIFIK